MKYPLQAFLANNFDGLILSPALFYSWEPGIRFEISDPALSFHDPNFMVQAHHGAVILFNEVFDEIDELLLVTDIVARPTSTILQQKPLNLYRKYVKDKRSLYQLQLETFSYGEYMEEELDEEDAMAIHRFSLKCQKTDLRFVQLLQAICYEDFNHPTTILKNNPESGIEVYFMNLSKKLIFHLYDDRGCDVLAADQENIRFLYEQYNDWILDYDRQEIDAVFQKDSSGIS